MQRTDIQIHYDVTHHLHKRSSTTVFDWFHPVPYEFRGEFRSMYMKRMNGSVSSARIVGADESRMRPTISEPPSSRFVSFR
jgi:hypothetical protein